MAKASAADLKKVIQANNKGLGKDFAAGNISGVAKRYAKGAKLLPPGVDVCKGKAIAGFWQGAFDAGVRGVALKAVEVEQLGTTAVEVGSYTLSLGDGTVCDKGKYLVVWKKDGKEWKLFRDIFNTSVAPAPAA